MNSYTAEAYRAAAEIACRAHGQGLRSPLMLAEEWGAEADRMDKLGEYGVKLSEKLRQRTSSYHYEMSPQAWGMQLVAALLEDGWTPPEGLL